MKFKIHYDGEYKDSLIVEGETISEVREKAFTEGYKRGWDKSKCWSEQIE